MSDNNNIVRFTKAHSNGNDFVIIDNRQTEKHHRFTAALYSANGG